MFQLNATYIFVYVIPICSILVSYCYLFFLNGSFSMPQLYGYTETSRLYNILQCFVYLTTSDDFGGLACRELTATLGAPRGLRFQNLFLSSNAK